MCTPSRAHQEVKDKAPEEQWRILLEVREYLLEGDEEERQAFESWAPTEADLDAEWRGLMARVPPDEAAEVTPDYEKAAPDDKKRMVWDVRKFLDEQEGEEGEEGAEPTSASGPGARPPPPPPRPPTDAELGGRNEVRRRGGATRGRDYERTMECGFDSGTHEGGDWDDYYSKEGRGGRKSGGGLSPMLMGGPCLLLGSLALLLTATAFADEDESVAAAALRLLHLA